MKAFLSSIALFFIIFSGFSPCLLAQDVEKNEIPDDLSQLIYKSALFPFFQQDYFTGMTALHVAQEKALFSNENTQAELLLGSLYLSYGMHDEAEAIFLQLASQLEDDPETLNRVWMQLGEIYYQSGEYSKAKDMMSRISDDLSDSLLQRATFVRGNALLKLDDHKTAIDLLVNDDEENIWYYYGLFNVGTKLLNSDNKEAGYNALNHLIGLSTSRVKEVRALQDKARIILGYHELKAGNAQTAINYFSGISLNSPYSRWGLYGLGRSAYAAEDYKGALNYWLALESHSAEQVPNIEAHLATSQLYFRLGALQQSLDGFNKTLEVCELEASQIDGIIEQLSNTDNQGFLTALLTQTNEELSNDSTFSPIFIRPYFTELLSGNRFNYLKENYKNLSFYKQHLLAWQQSIKAFDEVLTMRKQGFEKKLPMILNRHESLQLENLSAIHNQLSEAIQAADKQQNSMVLANESELKLLDKLKQVEDKLALFKDHMDAKKYNRLHEKYTRLKGILVWNLDTDFKPRLRKLNKGRQEIANLLEETKTLDNALKKAQKNAPEEFANYTNRIDGYRTHIEQLLSTVDSLNEEIVGEVKNHIIEILEQRKEHITKLHTHARFPVAQIYDLSVTNQQQENQE